MTKPQNLTQLAEQNKKVQQELDSRKKEYQYLADRHDALFKLNRLLSECKDIRDFYFQVHNVVASLMVAYNFYIVLYDQTFEEIEFVYHVDEYDKTPIGKIPFENFNGKKHTMGLHMLPKQVALKTLENHRKRNGNTLKNIRKTYETHRKRIGNIGNI